MTKTERLAQAQAVSGWMDEIELGWLYDNALGKSLVIEFGSWLGRSTTALLAAQRVVCIDHWLGSQEHKAMIEARELDVYAEFVERFANEIASGQLVVERVDLRGSCFAAYGGQADLVFVDAAMRFRTFVRIFGLPRLW